MLPWDLENWLTDAGDEVVCKAAERGTESLDSRERLIYEVWLFDTEQRNGGVSQYFLNRGLKQWDALCAAALPVLSSFAPFATAVSQAVGRSEDPCQAVMNSSVDLDAHYYQYQIRLATELKAQVERRNVPVERRSQD